MPRGAWAGYSPRGGKEANMTEHKDILYSSCYIYYIILVPSPCTNQGRVGQGSVEGIPCESSHSVEDMR